MKFINYKSKTKEYQPVNLENVLTFIGYGEENGYVIEFVSVRNYTKWTFDSIKERDIVYDKILGIIDATTITL